MQITIVNVQCVSCYNITQHNVQGIFQLFLKFHFVKFQYNAKRCGQ